MEFQFYEFNERCRVSGSGCGVRKLLQYNARISQLSEEGGSRVCLARIASCSARCTRKWFKTRRWSRYRKSVLIYNVCIVEIK